MSAAISLWGAVVDGLSVPRISDGMETCDGTGTSNTGRDGFRVPNIKEGMSR